MKTKIIGIIGCGVVGGGVVNILQNQMKLLRNIGLNIVIKSICVKNLNKKRDFALPKNTKLTSDPDIIIKDKDIDTVIEVMGGVYEAKKVVFDSILNGKNVVTANKALISKHLLEINTLVTENDVQFGYEAAVCGGIPIIHTLQKDLLLDNVTEVSGIINGTTNYILSRISTENIDLDSVIDSAKTLGYAEADPTADIEGYDIRSKLGIISKLAFGHYIPESMIETQGITNIIRDDFLYAKMLNSTIKMIGTSKLVNNRLQTYVSPMLVSNNHNFSQVHGATNIVEIKSDNLESTLLTGEGAGRYPTANSVVSDLISIFMNNSSVPFPKNETFGFEQDYEKCFYVRFIVKDQIGIIKNIGEVCNKYNISIDSIQQLPISDNNYVPFVITTNETNIKNIKSLCVDVNMCDYSQEYPFYMPIY